jgi:hypothetical protein|tara:strand:+ start:557 stop:886 length:330 start_codon:yes stop_codon:yes gene_type:complete
MKNNEEKIYINGSYLRQVDFDNGGSIIKWSIPNVSEFADELIKHANELGKITIDIKTRQEKSDTGITHFLQKSTFIPKEQPKDAQPQQKTESSPYNTEIKKEKSDGLPF